MHIGDHAVCGVNRADGFLVQVQVANALRNCHGCRCEPLYSTTMVRQDQNMRLWCPRLSCCLLTYRNRVSPGELELHSDCAKIRSCVAGKRDDNRGRWSSTAMSADRLSCRRASSRRFVTPGRGCVRGPRNTSHERGQSGDRIAGR